ncbi:MAG: hypothetical protein ACM3S1_16670 [Hyphomicrobiales bacterium]
MNRWIEVPAALAVGGALRLLFLPEPPMVLTPEKRAAFEQLAAAALKGTGEALDYGLPYPRYEFLRFLAARGDLLFRGMPGPPLEVLAPTENTDARQRRVRAVFASADPAWPLFFGTLQVRDAQAPVSLRNAAFAVGHGPRTRRYYYFSLNREFAATNPWAAATVYILPRAPFRPVGTGLVRFDEWLAEEPVRPLATLAVTPGDFPFRERIATHDRREGMWKTWLLYRWRTRRRSRG